jgi:hypothetical protein
MAFNFPRLHHLASFHPGVSLGQGTVWYELKFEFAKGKT